MKKVILLALLAVFLTWYFYPSDDEFSVHQVKRNDNSQIVERTNSYASMLKTVLPKVVTVSVSSKQERIKYNPFIQRFRRLNDLVVQGAGSGVVVSDKGHIITNYHVIKDSSLIHVDFQDEQLVAEVMGVDATTDLALLKIDKETVPIEFSDSDTLLVGDVVLAIGNAFGIGNTVTSGIVSALGRGLGLNLFESFIQTDAAINMGNSGGALINTQGDLVGINAAILSRTGNSSGVAFAIPANMVYDIFLKILKDGKVVRGFLGAGLIEENDQVLIAQILPGMAADKAKLRVDDVVKSVGGTAVKTAKKLAQLISDYPPGEETTLEIERDGEDKTVTVIIGQRPDE